MKKTIVTLLIILSSTVVCLSQIISSFEIIVTGKDYEKQVNSDATFKINFKSNDTASQIIQTHFAYSINADDYLQFDAKKTYSLKNLDFITFRVIREIINKNKAENSSNSLDTSYIKFSTQHSFKSDTLHNSSFFVASFVKSIAGNKIPDNELLDLYLKLTFGRQKQWFSFLGADAGLSATSNTADLKNVFRINEAVVNINYAFYRKKLYKIPKLKDASNRKISNEEYTKRMLLINDAKQKNEKYWSNELNRTGFMGVGIKVFNTQPYIGIHAGFTEINGPLFGSYIMAGFYSSPYSVDSTDIAKGGNPFKHNVYFEACLNAFGLDVPNILKSIRLKFGLMLPIGNSKVGENPSSKDVQSRLAIEVPLGKVFKF
jgi:hypothetical protein